MEVDGAMKVQNTAIFMGNDQKGLRQGSAAAKEKDGTKNVYAGNLNKQLDPIAQKQQQAKKQVMKIIGDARASDRKLEDDLAGRRSNIKKQQETIGKANDELKRIGAARRELRESYGIAEDSQEEQDLRLLEKERNSKKPGSEIYLTKEEGERLEQIKEEGLTEYQKRSMEMLDNGSPYEMEISEAEKEMKAENAAISSIKTAMLKSKTMLKAKEAAEDVMEAARDEIVGMLWDEAKDHIDEELEEKKEAAEEKAEKEKEEKEKLEKQKEDKEEKEQFAEQVAASTKFMVEADSAMSEVQKEIKKIMNEMKLTEEDLKGAAVDTTK